MRQQYDANNNLNQAAGAILNAQTGSSVTLIANTISQEGRAFELKSRDITIHASTSANVFDSRNGDVNLSPSASGNGDLTIVSKGNLTASSAAAINGNIQLSSKSGSVTIEKGLLVADMDIAIFCQSNNTLTLSPGATIRGGGNVIIFFGSSRVQAQKGTQLAGTYSHSTFPQLNNLAISPQDARVFLGSPALINASTFAQNGIALTNTIGVTNGASVFVNPGTLGGQINFSGNVSIEAGLAELPNSELERTSAVSDIRPVAFTEIVSAKSPIKFAHNSSYNIWSDLNADLFSSNQKETGLTLYRGEILMECLEPVVVTLGSNLFVRCKRGSIIHVENRAGKVSIRCMWNACRRAPEVLAGGNSFELCLGQELSVSWPGDKSNCEFPVRRIKTANFGSGLILRTAEFSIPALLSANLLFSSVYSSKATHTIQARLLKIAACLALVTSDHGVYTNAGSH